MYEYKAEVKRVVDGDTLDLLIDLGFDVYVATRVHLLGVDTPEVYGTRKRDPEQYERGLVASAFVRDWIDQFGGRVLVRTSKGKGKYGRWLAVILPPEGAADSGGGVSLNQALLDSGNAIVPDYG